MSKVTKDAQSTLEAALETMKEKILQHKNDFAVADLTYAAEMGDGREILRANPEVQEYRALVKDYCQVVKAYKEISEAKEPASISNIEDIRSRFKVAK